MLGIWFSRVVVAFGYLRGSLWKRQSLLAQSDLYGFNKTIQKDFIGKHANTYNEHYFSA